MLLEEFGAESEALSISTDDGSRGYRGLVTDLLERDIEERGFDIIYTCGPTPMIRKVSEISKNGYSMPGFFRTENGLRNRGMPCVRM